MLLAHYKLNDDAADTVVADASGNALHGTASANTDTLAVAAKLNGGLNFAASHYATLPDGTSSGLGGASGATIITWVKRSGVGTRQFLFRTEVAATKTKAAIEFQSNNTIKAGGRSIAGDSYQTVTTAGTYTDTGDWHMLAAVFDLPNDSIKIYYDGELAAEGNVNFGQNTFSADVGDTGAIGAFGPTGHYKLNGIQDETRLYKEALPEWKIKALYNFGRGSEECQPWQRLIRRTIRPTVSHLIGAA